MKQQDNTELVNRIKGELIEKLSKKIFGILQYGSSVSARRLPNDLDMIVILNERETVDDMNAIHNIVKNISKKIDIQIINKHDIYPETFSHDTHGQFFIPFIKSAKVIYGENPFENLHVSFSALVTSVEQKSQYYYFRAKKQIANIDRPADNGEFEYHRKKILLMLSDIRYIVTGSTLWYESVHHLCEFITYLTKERPSKKELDFLTGPVSGASLDFIFSLYRKYYYAIIDLLHFKYNKSGIYIETGSYVELLNRGSSNLCLILPGCPSDYEEKICSYLSIIGFDVGVIHYSGTGKSKTTNFRDPAEDVNDVVQHFKNNYKNIVLIANSYGGYVSFTLSNKTIDCVNKIICVSPAISMPEVKNSDTLASYVTNERGYWYRFKENDFDKYLKNATRKQLFASENTLFCMVKKMSK